MLQTTEKNILSLENEEENEEEVVLDSNETKNEININNVTDMVENQMNIWGDSLNVCTLYRIIVTLW